MGHASRHFYNHATVGRISVFVPPSNLLRLRDAYRRIPGIIVHPFKLRASRLTIITMLILIAVQTTGHQPLYMSTIRAILRTVATEWGGPFDYKDFRNRLR